MTCQEQINCIKGRDRGRRQDGKKETKRPIGVGLGGEMKQAARALLHNVSGQIRNECFWSMIRFATLQV